MQQIQLNKRKFRIPRRAEPIYALVDDEDFEWLNQWNWTIMPDQKTGLLRAMRMRRDEEGKQRVVLMHREIMQPPSDMEIDHIDGNGLNNTRSNLRIVTRIENLRNRGMFKNNTSGAKGVTQIKNGKWEMNFSATFDTQADAANAYAECARLIYGEFTRSAEK